MQATISEDNVRWLQPQEPRDLEVRVSFSQAVEGTGPEEGLMVFLREVHASAVRQDNGRTQFVDALGVVIAAWDSDIIEQIDWPDGIGFAPTPFRNWLARDRYDWPSRLRKLREKRPHAYKRWETEEDERLAAEFEEGTTIAEIADLHGRGESAILSRLIKLSLVNRDTEPPDTTHDGLHP